MNEFFDRFKKGASEASEKAKAMIEINKIKLQIIQKNKELDEYYKRMGQRVFERYDVGELSQMDAFIEDLCVDCVKKQEEIKQLEDKIKALGHQKECPNCHEILDEEINFCPSCGEKLLK